MSRRRSRRPKNPAEPRDRINHDRSGATSGRRWSTLAPAVNRRRHPDESNGLKVPAGTNGFYLLGGGLRRTRPQRRLFSRSLRRARAASSSVQPNVNLDDVAVSLSLETTPTSASMPERRAARRSSATGTAGQSASEDARKFVRASGWDQPIMAIKASDEAYPWGSRFSR